MNSNRPVNYLYQAVGGIAAGVFVLFPLSTIAAGLPTAGQVVAGSGSISESGNTLTVTQTSATMVADWQSFSIGQGNTVNFVQPSASAVVLNRVMGADVSVIQGALNANGQVFLVNPNGVLFTPTAQVNVGALVASSLELSTEDFLAGNYRFSGNSTAGVINQGAITTAVGGTVALIAARIENTGSITAPEGNVLMGAGRKVRLDLGGPVKIEVEEGALNTLIEQGGGIYADGGLVYLTAKAAGDLASSVINHTGLTQARGIATNQQGEIYLMGDMAQGSLQVAGTLDAAAHEGKAGFIETSAHQVKIADEVNVKASEWLIDPYDFTIAAAGGDISGMALSTALNNTNVTIETTDSGVNCTDIGVACGSGNASGNGDIFVNDAISWSTNKKLTLSAYRNIKINADITAQHVDGKVHLNYGQSTPKEGNTAVYSFNGGKINLQAGDNFSTKLGNGTDPSDQINWKVVTQLGSEASTTGNDLQGIQGKLSGNYVLGADIDASDTSGWGSTGFTPIGQSGSRFNGQFDGLGHTIRNLTINGDGHVGLFGFAENVTIRNVGLENINITGKYIVGGLVGWLQATGTSSASIINSYTTGSIKTLDSSGDKSGGLVGLMKSDGGKVEVISSYSAATIEGLRDVGGLVGKLEAKAGGTSSILNSYAVGNVSATTSNVGGLVGLFEVEGNSNASIFNSYAIGKITSSSDSKGGLVGFIQNNGINTINISNSFWDVDTTGIATDVTVSAVTGDTVNINNTSGKTTAEMQDIATFKTGNAWSIVLDESYTGDYFYPRLTMSAGLPVWKIKSEIVNIEYYLSGSTNSYEYNGEDYLLENIWNAEAIFGTTYKDWQLGADYIFKYKGLPIDKFFNADHYTGISIQVLKNGFSASGSPSTFTITPRPITVTADIISKIYGDPDPILTYKVTTGNLVGNDVLTGSLSRVSGESVGSYSLDGNGLYNSNYAITGVNGGFTITSRPITITIDSLTKSLGYIDPIFTYKVTQGSLVPGDSLGGENISEDNFIPSSSGTNDKLASQGGSISITNRNSVKVYSDLNLVRAEGEVLGDYVISADSLTNHNYSITKNNGTLKIQARPVVVNSLLRTGFSDYSLNDFEGLNMNIEQGGINLGGK